jgi:transcriptional regulatory protein GAL4
VVESVNDGNEHRRLTRDQDLTVASTAYPSESDEITPYTAVRTQAAFHMATKSIYTRVISKPFPTAKELLHLDDSLIVDWLSKLPLFFAEQAFIPTKYSFAHAVNMWRYRNFRIIMYRPFVIRKAVYARSGRIDQSPESYQAYERCLEEARSTITSIQDYWNSNDHNRLAAWYAL